MDKAKILKALKVDITINSGEYEDFLTLDQALEKGYIEETEKYVYSLTELGENLKDKEDEEILHKTDCVDSYSLRSIFNAAVRCFNKRR